jgi:hypothetical protein
MKHVTPTEARKNWFRLLDEVADGEVVVLERKGRRLVLKRQDSVRGRFKVPDYRGLFSAPNADEADRWGWRWSTDEGGLVPKDLGPQKP